MEQVLEQSGEKGSDFVVQPGIAYRALMFAACDLILGIDRRFSSARCRELWVDRLRRRSVEETLVLLTTATSRLWSSQLSTTSRSVDLSTPGDVESLPGAEVETLNNWAMQRQRGCGLRARAFRSGRCALPLARQGRFRPAPASQRRGDPAAAFVRGDGPRVRGRAAANCR
jgi:hypothetical protein